MADNTRMKRLILPAAFAFLVACQTGPVPVLPPPPDNVPAPLNAAETRPTTGQQWLFGSAESRVALVQDWNAIATYVEAKAAARPNASAVLSAASTADAPDFLGCGDKPLAAVFDADETLIWNLGSMAAFTRLGKDFDVQIWDQWEKTGAGKAVAIPGVIDALGRIRAAGVEVIVNTNRSAENAAGTEDTLRAAGIGDFHHGSTLFLRGDAPDGSGKDGRRALISNSYCVIALAGDQLGDIADIFNAKTLSPPERKALTAAPAFDAMWGNGWFVLPNPVYGPSVGKGTMDETFPPNTYWEPAPAE